MRSIRGVHDEQDVRKLVGLTPRITYATTLISSLSLNALPYMMGLFSKHFILQYAFGMFDMDLDWRLKPDVYDDSTQTGKSS